jgi:hypothetical protein
LPPLALLPLHAHAAETHVVRYPIAGGDKLHLLTAREENQRQVGEHMGSIETRYAFPTRVGVESMV